MSDQDQQLAEVSPFSPYKEEPYEVTIRGTRYKVRRPKRSEIRGALARSAAQIISPSHGGMLTDEKFLESFLVEAECFLPFMIQEAPPHWYTKGDLDLDLVEGEELGEVWKAVISHWPGKFSQHRTMDDEKKD
jgi:hypothetical protein